jgi:DNA-directed RNA polymerase specialized sigma24 family protein
MDSNIQTLVFKAKQGDNSAFSTLYQIYYPKMKGICINILKEDKDVIDDLVQDAFILALDYLHISNINCKFAVEI